MSEFWPSARRSQAWVLASTLMFGAGCPANEDGVGNESETGETPEPEPIDPFDGEGIDPPGEPDESLTYQPPSSLGNGMVHDSRLDLLGGEYEHIATPLELAAGVDWSTFVKPHAEKLRVGFRPSAVDAEVGLAVDGGALSLSIEDRSVYVCDDDANFRTVTKTHVFSDLGSEQALAASGPSAPGMPRPTAIHNFAVELDRFGFHIVWTYDNSDVDWRLVTGQSEAAFLAIVEVLGSLGFRPISISSRRRNGANEYAGIFVNDGVAREDWLAMLGLTGMELAEESAAAWEAGYYPFRGSYVDGSAELPRFDVLWIRRSPGLKLELRFNLDRDLFEEQDQMWRKAGYYLEGATGYRDGGEERFAGMWVRHEPYLRWTEGIPIDPLDPIYVARYLPFHEQAIQKMTLAGESKEGEFFRPSSTLHIYEGLMLVLNRAYTYAPAIYPDTPLDAPMPLASASKSITATAVVRQMNIEGMPLTTPFAPMAGIDKVPAMATAPSVLEVLRNLGGFNEEVLSYNDHALIDQSIYGDYPITGKMMYDYAVHGGHLNTGDEDSYWTSSTYSMAKKAGWMAYSNAGYSMLGELLRIRTGSTYEDYVRTNLLVPLSIHHAVYPDPGHRNAHRVPTKVGLRSYLSNSKHPYKFKLPFLRSEAVPGPNDGDSSPWWSPNAGPIHSSAPQTAAITRYAGKSHLGGAPLAAGGWYGDGKSLGLLIRVIAQTSFLLPLPVAAQMWNPQWWNGKHKYGSTWVYGLGWWIRGNWIAMAGGTDGSMSLVSHNLKYDFTVVYLTNVKGNALDEYLNPLMTPTKGIWGTSTLGNQFPCVDDLTTFLPECFGSALTY